MPGFAAYQIRQLQDRQRQWRLDTGSYTAGSLPGGRRYSDAALYGRLEQAYGDLGKRSISGADLARLSNVGASGSQAALLAQTRAMGGDAAQARAAFAANEQRMNSQAYDRFIQVEMDAADRQQQGRLGLLALQSQDSLARNELVYGAREGSKNRRASFWNSVIGGVLGTAGTVIGAG
jgi:hypothetical protein